MPAILNEAFESPFNNYKDLNPHGQKKSLESSSDNVNIRNPEWKKGSHSQSQSQSQEHYTAHTDANHVNPYSFNHNSNYTPNSNSNFNFNTTPNPNYMIYNQLNHSPSTPSNLSNQSTQFSPSNFTASNFNFDHYTPSNNHYTVQPSHHSYESVNHSHKHPAQQFLNTGSQNYNITAPALNMKHDCDNLIAFMMSCPSCRDKLFRIFSKQDNKIGGSIIKDEKLNWDTLNTSIIGNFMFGILIIILINKLIKVKG